MSELQRRIRTMLDGIPVVDVHTHLGGNGIRQARNLADLVGYHWVHLELARAGADIPDEDASTKDPEDFMRKVLPFFPAIRTTSNHFVLMGLLRDLFGFTERTITPGNWRALDDKIRKQAADASWITTVLDRAKVKKLPVPLKDGMPDDSGRYVPYEYGEYLFAMSSMGRLVELEKKAGHQIKSIADLREAIGARVASLKKKHGVRALHIWIRDSWIYQRCHEEDAADLFFRVRMCRTLTTGQDDLLISFSADILADAAAQHGMTIQLFHGMEFYHRNAPQCVSSYWNPDLLRSLPKFCAAHQSTNVDLFLATRIPSHEAASIARGCPNLSVSGGWWHGFTPSCLVTFFKDRLEMLPNTAWNAFFSDGYIVEWIYAKLLMTKQCLAQAFAEEIEGGLMTEDDAPEIARRLLHDNALKIYKW